MKNRNVTIWNLLYIMLVPLVMVIPAITADFAELKAKGDRYWESRDNQLYLLKAIDWYTRAFEMRSDDENLLIRLSTAYWWKGNGIPEKEKRKEAYAVGAKYAENICRSNPNSIGGNFWYATNRASYCREVGFIKSAFLLPELNSRMKIVMEQDKLYDHGGPQRLLARVVYHTPIFFRGISVGTLEDAEKMLHEAIGIAPTFTTSYLFLSDIYREMGRIDLAKQALEKVLSISETARPEFTAENRMDKKKARELINKYYKK
ncbi:MAG: tetratricopeptide repeat protein [Desulfobacterales bacterium]|nr:tetratricopeptide repeat protein [Desulfobacterales bacterium]